MITKIINMRILINNLSNNVKKNKNKKSESQINNNIFLRVQKKLMKVGNKV